MVYVTLYELIAIVVATFGLPALTGQNASRERGFGGCFGDRCAVEHRVQLGVLGAGVAPGGAGRSVKRRIARHWL